VRSDRNSRSPAGRRQVKLFSRGRCHTYRSVIRRSSTHGKAYAFESISLLYRPSDRARRSAVGRSQSDLRLSRLSRPILGQRCTVLQLFV
jgi:hypothetical protein